MNDGTQRWRLGPLHHPVRGLMDLTAAAVAVAGGVVLVTEAHDAGSRLAIGVYALCLVFLFVVSGLYHSIPWPARYKRGMQLLDHSMIFLLIAGTCTPVAALLLDGAQRSVALVALWTVTSVGVALRWVQRGGGNVVTIVFVTALGWVAGLILAPAVHRLGGGGVVLAVAGGVLYTVGMLMLVTRRPRLWPRVFSYHEAFHVLVIAAALCHWSMLQWHVLPAAV